MEIIGTIVIILVSLAGVAVVGGFLMLLYAAMEMMKRGDLDD